MTFQPVNNEHPFDTTMKMIVQSKTLEEAKGIAKTAIIYTDWMKQTFQTITVDFGEG